MKIFVFGDSFSQPYGNPNFKRLHWSNHLGIALDCEIKMFAKCGAQLVPIGMPKICR